MSGIKKDIYWVCPFCWTVRVKSRVYKNPRYLCEVCRSEFNSKTRITYDERKLFNDVLKTVHLNISKMVILANYPESKVRQKVVEVVKLCRK